MTNADRSKIFNGNTLPPPLPHIHIELITKKHTYMYVVNSIRVMDGCV